MRHDLNGAEHSPRAGANREVLIAGGGIAGFATALALAQRGVRVRVLERAEQATETGAGIQVPPNAAKVLHALGLEAALAHVVVEPTSIVIMGRDGRPLAQAPLGRAFAERFGAPWQVVYRPDLLGVLYEAATREPRIAIEFGRTVDGVAVTPFGVTVTSVGDRDVHEHAGDALIGCDGLWSRVRDRLGCVEAPVFRNRSAWRAMIPPDRLPGGLDPKAIHLWLGPGAHLVHYPVRGGKLVNIVAIVSDTWSELGWSADGDPGQLEPHFAAWSKTARDLVGAPDRYLKWALADRAVWFGPGEGAVTLAGDAAHPMLPFLAQGGASAIEDAAVIAREVASGDGSLAPAFRRYEADRRKRVSRIQATARMNGQVYHWQMPFSGVRDAVIKARGSAGLISRYDWLYSYDAVKAPAAV